MKLAIGIPHTGTLKTRTVSCLVSMIKELPFEYNVLFQEGSILHINRERIVKKAIDLGCTHLLFLDADMYFEKDAILKLLKHNKDIIGANYHLRTIPAVATVKNPKKLKGLTECDAVATGFLLIDLNVFKKLPQPYFFWQSNDKGELVEGEDNWFCRIAREAGFKIWCDLSVNIGHIGEYIY